MIFPGLGKVIWGGLRPQTKRPNDFCRLWKKHLEGLRPQTTKPQKEAKWSLRALENYMGGLRSLITFGGLRPKTTKGGQMIFSGPWNNHLGGLRPHKMRPNDFCRLWKNHLEGLRPQTTKRGQMVFEGLGKVHGRLEVLNHIWRPEAQNHKRRPNDFSEPWKSHLGGPEAPENGAK